MSVNQPSRASEVAGPPPGEGVQFCATTRRDGEPAPGATLHLGDKVEMAHQRARLQVDVIGALLRVVGDLGADRPATATVAS
ncbi:MAG: hypothetical protein ACYCYK_00855 [Candidatus Dormibacteria bacterium]